MRNRAFTLLELLFIVALIAALAGIAVPNFLGAQIRSKVSRAQSDMAATAAGLEAYMSDWRVYPPHPVAVTDYYRGLASRQPFSPAKSSEAAFGDEATSFFGDSVDRRIQPSAPNPFGDPFGFSTASSTKETTPTISIGGMVLAGSSALNRLTTPIAYYDNIVLVDSFSDSRSRYRYVNTAPLDAEFPALAASVPRRRFLLFSFGPDADEGTGGGWGRSYSPHSDKVTNTMTNPVWGPYIDYDSTNGTISPGDLLNFGTN